MNQNKTQSNFKSATTKTFEVGQRQSVKEQVDQNY